MRKQYVSNKSIAAKHAHDLTLQVMSSCSFYLITLLVLIFVYDINQLSLDITRNTYSKNNCCSKTL